MLCMYSADIVINYITPPPPLVVYVHGRGPSHVWTSGWQKTFLYDIEKKRPPLFLGSNNKKKKMKNLRSYMPFGSSGIQGVHCKFVLYGSCVHDEVRLKLCQWSNVSSAGILQALELGNYREKRLREKLWISHTGKKCKRRKHVRVGMFFYILL